MSIKTVIADDEPLARDRIKRFIAADMDLELVQECSNGPELVRTVLSRDVDLVLLDIHMPGINGLDAMKEIEASKLPMVVFTTAHDRYAISAFEMNAVDYLLKPIESERFRQAIKRVKERAHMKAAADSQKQLASVLTSLQSINASASRAYLAHVIVRSGTKELFINVDEIAWIEAADYYACLHVGEKKHLLRESVKDLEENLDPRRFVRIHRSTIVNASFVREIHREGRSEGWALLSNGDRVRMSIAGWRKLLAFSRSG